MWRCMSPTFIQVVLQRTHLTISDSSSFRINGWTILFAGEMWTNSWRYSFINASFLASLGVVILILTLMKDCDEGSCLIFRSTAGSPRFQRLRIWMTWIRTCNSIPHYLHLYRCEFVTQVSKPMKAGRHAVDDECSFSALLSKVIRVVGVVWHHRFAIVPRYVGTIDWSTTNKRLTVVTCSLGGTDT
jgi:hypothetical protein